MMVRIRYFCYFSLFFAGILFIFWLKYNWQIINYYKNATQPIAEAYMRYALRDYNIVLSLTTTPYRIAKLQPVLETLYKQNVPISSIYLSIPHVFKRDNVAYAIPQWLAAESRVTILRPDDFGPATKLLGVLEQIKFPANTILITVDDDTYYPPNLMLNLAYAAKQLPDTAIATFGCDLDYDPQGKIKAPGTGTILRFEPNALITMVLGYTGVAYRPEFFDEKIFAIQTAPKECAMIDDFYISFHLARRNIPRRTLGSKYVSYDNVENCYETAYQPEALFMLTPNRAQYNAVCLAYLQAQYPNVNF